MAFFAPPQIVTPTAEADNDEDDAAHLHEEADVHFEPIVKLEAVEVQTLEEAEDVVFHKRARLYRYDLRLCEWKERGTGDIKLLKHKDSGVVRVLMRREKTLKICANHRVSLYMHLRPHQGSNRTWMYTVYADFADEEPRHEVFAIRFADKEKADEFKEAFDVAKASNAVLTGEQVPEDSKSGASSESESDSEEEEEEEKKKDEQGEVEITEDLKKLDVSEKTEEKA